MVTLKSKYIQAVDIAALEESLILKTSKKQALYLKNISYNDIELNAIGRDLVITVKDTEKSVILKDYIKKNGKHSYKYIQTDEGERVQTMDIINDGLVDNPNTISIPQKGITVTGTNFNDIINVSEYKVATSGSKKGKGLTVKALNGNDKITGTTGNDTIIGGLGTNIIYLSTTEPFGNDVVTLTKGEKLHFYVDMKDEKGSNIEYEIQGKNLIITVYDDVEKTNLMGTVTIKNYTKKDVLTSSGELRVYNLDGELVQDLRNLSFITKLDKTYKSSSVSGSWINDDIDASEYQLYSDKKRTVENNNSNKKGLTISTGAGTNTVIGSKYSDTIKGGAGNDEIEGGMGNDNITAGKGNNVLKFNGSFGDDVVTLTKGENLILDFSSYMISDVSGLKFEIVKNDIKIIVPDGSGTVLLKNFAKTNVVGTSGSVLIKLAGTTIDMNKDEFLHFIKDDFTKTGFFTGSRLSEIIDATGLTMGATINAGAGNNLIISTDGNYDKITAGNDGNTVELKTGTKVVTTGSGADIINIAGIGARTIKAGAGNNTININNSSDFGCVTVVEQKLKAANDIRFTNDIDNTYTLIKTGNDLMLSGQNSNLTVKDYFTANSKSATTTFYENNDNELSLEDLVASVQEFVVTGKGTVIGTKHDNVVKTNDVALTGSASNDTIKAGKGNDIINAGRGKNSIYFYAGDGNDTIENGGGTDTLVFERNTAVSCSLDNNKLTITYGNLGDTIVVNNYSTAHSVKYIKIGTTKKAVSDYLPKPAPTPPSTKSPTEIPAGMDSSPAQLNGSIRGTEGDDVLVGTSGNDTIKALGGNDIIYAGAGADNIMGGAGNDQVYAGKGNDVILGGGGQNTFYFAKGDGNDTIQDPGRDNTFFFYGLNDVSDLIIYSEKNTNNDFDLIITGYGTSYDKVTIKTFISGDPSYKYDYSNYKLQAEGKDAVILYDVIINSDSVSDELKATVASFMADTQNGGDAPQLLLQTNSANSGTLAMVTGISA